MHCARTLSHLSWLSSELSSTRNWSLCVGVTTSILPDPSTSTARLPFTREKAFSGW